MPGIVGKASRKGLLLGCAAGVVCSLIDSVLFFLPDVYIPKYFPVVLYCSNTVFWGLFGVAAGCCAGLYLKFRGEGAMCEQRVWTICFLAPFSLLYGVMGSMPLPLITMVKDPVQAGGVSVLPFVPVVMIPAFRFLYAARGKIFSPFMLLTDVLACCLLYYACTNSGYAANVLASVLHAAVSPAMLYAVSIVVVYGLYAVCLVCAHRVYDLLAAHTSARLSACCLIVAPLVISAAGAAGNMALPETSRPAGSSRASVSLDAERHPTVILIVVDTLRSDRLSVYNDIPTSPCLSALAQDSVVFAKCIAPSSWTLPSHASLFSGFYPAEHMCAFNNSRLAPAFETMAESIRKHGYFTAAVVANYGWLNRRFKLDQGFDLYDCRENIGRLRQFSFRPLLLTLSYGLNLYVKSVKSYRSADDITDLAIHYIAEQRGSRRPLFLFINYMDVHTPYYPPRPFADLHAEAMSPQLFRLSNCLKDRDRRLLSPIWNRFLLTQYDGEVTFVDAEIGRLMEQLKRWNMYDPSLVVVTSDHGELLGERGFYEHHHCPPLEGLIRLPLLIKYPNNRRRGVEKRTINLTDVYPTIASICNLQVPEGLSGKKFGDPEQSGFAEAYGLWVKSGTYKVLYDDRFKYIYYSNGEPPPELYDLTKDPLEKKNLATEENKIASDMHTAMGGWIARHKQKLSADRQEPGPLTGEVQQHLRALGYVD